MEIIMVSNALELAKLNGYLHNMHVKERVDIFKQFDLDAVASYFQHCLQQEQYYHPGIMMNGELAGFAQAEIMTRLESPFAYPYRYIHIPQLSVHPAFRRMGIAKALVAAIENFAAKEAISRIDLTVWDFNEEAIAFYQAAGFRTDMLRMYKMV
jgi:ribosomal protein S18 acetylase RimI-like enzyme